MPTFFPFDPKLDDDTIKKPDLVKLKLNEAVQAIGVRDTEITRLTLAQAELQQRSSEALKALQLRSDELEATRKALAEQAGRLQAVTEQLKAVQTAVPKIGVQDLVGQFKSHIDRVNADVLQRKTGGMLVDSVEVEVRGGIDVRDGLQLTQIDSAALGLAAVSTLKFNLKPASVLKIVDE